MNNDDLINRLEEKENLYKEKSENLYFDFINKIIIYSYWIITTSITIFITLNEKWNINELKLFFTLIIFYSFISVLFWMLIKFIYSKFFFNLSEISRNSKKYFLPELDNSKIMNDEIYLGNKNKNLSFIRFSFFCIMLISFMLSIIFIIILFLNFK